MDSENLGLNPTSIVGSITQLLSPETLEQVSGIFERSSMKSEEHISRQEQKFKVKTGSPMPITV